MEKLKELNEIEANFQAALKAATQLPEAHEFVQEAFRLRDLARQEVEVKFMDLTPLKNSIDINSQELRNFYNEIRGSANLMSRNMEKWGDPSSKAWREANLTTVTTPGGLSAVVHKAAAPYFQGFLNELEAEFGYAIKQISGFNYRLKRDGKTLSEHAFGNAIDINWDLNPMMQELRTNLPKEIGRIAAKYGLSWGGDWRNVKDPMHFEWTGRVPPGIQPMSKAELEVYKRITAELQKQNEERRKQQESTQRLIDDNKFAIEQEERRLAGKQKEAFIEEQIRRARQQNPNITPEELQLIREQAALLWERQQALTREEQIKERIRQINEQIRYLEQERNALLEQRSYYEQRGDLGGMQQVDQQLKIVNEELRNAIRNAIAFWESIGGPQASAAIAKLEATALGIREVGEQSIINGQRITQNFASGLVDAFDNFARSVANGENAIKSLGQAFRQFAGEFLLQIAKMIMQQSILNALQRMGFAGAFGALGGLFHSGGVVGSVGTPKREISPLWFRNALRYHNGGIAGLRPGEVPAILKVGEEVLTEDDPRHIRNGGGHVQLNARVVNMFDAASFLSEALSTKVGEKVILNFVRANAGAFRSALNG
mgnify:CR=1 FL=1